MSRYDDLGWWGTRMSAPGDLPLEEQIAKCLKRGYFMTDVWAFLAETGRTDMTYSTFRRHCTVAGINPRQRPRMVVDSETDADAPEGGRWIH